MKIAVIAAVSKNMAIGKEGKLLWKIPADMLRFRELTDGHPVIMGRKTYESIPERYRPLKNRANIVITSHPEKISFDRSGVTLVSGPTDALSKAMSLEREVAFVAGGAEIYRLMLPMADVVYLTWIDDEIEGDAFFPHLDSNIWEEVERQEFGEKEGYINPTFSFITFTRKS